MSDGEKSEEREKVLSNRPRSSPHQRARERQKRLNLVFSIAAAFIAVAALILLVLVWQRDRIQRHFAVRAADRLVVEAEEAMGRGDEDGAAKLVLEALARDQAHYEANRVAARLEMVPYPESAASRFAYLYRKGVATVEDRIDLLILCARLAEWEKAEVLVEELLGEGVADGELFSLAAKVALWRGDRERGEQMIAKAMEMDAGHEMARLLKAWLQLGSVIPDVNQVGLNAICELAQSDNRGIAGLDALRLIFVRRQELLFPLEKYYLLFKEHPLRPAEFDPTLAILAWEFDLYPGEKEERASAAMKAWSDAGLKGEDMEERLRWLSENGCARQVATFLETSEGVEDIGMVTALLRSLIAGGDLEGADEVVQRLRADPRHEVFSLLWEAMVMAGRERPAAEIQGILVEALALARRTTGVDPEFFFRSAEFARERGMNGVAREAYFQALTDDPMRARVGLADIEEREGKWYEMLEHIEEALVLEPGNRKLRAVTAYHQLLFGIHVDDGRANAERLYQLSPENPGMRLLAAFAHHVFGESEEALALAREVDVSKVESRQRVVLVKIFREGGEEAEAARVADGINRAELLPQEVAMLEGTD